MAAQSKKSKCFQDGHILVHDAEDGEDRDAVWAEKPVSDLQKIPGIGANMERHLHNIGIHCIADLKGRDPEELYHLDCLKKGFQEDRCVLYVFRCAVYFAEQDEHESEKLKWWYWKDRKYPEKGVPK